MLAGSPILSEEKQINAKHKYSVIVFKNLPIIRLLVSLEFIRVLNFLLRVKKLAKKFIMIIIIKILANFLPIFVTRKRQIRTLRNSRDTRSLLIGRFSKMIA